MKRARRIAGLVLSVVLVGACNPNKTRSEAQDKPEATTAPGERESAHAAAPVMAEAPSPALAGKRASARSRGPAMQQPQPQLNTESYAHQEENPFKLVKTDPLSTFSVDTDTASYANVRRMLKEGTMPPKGAVRVEEMINYFAYDYPPPTGGAPFSTSIEVAACPWDARHMLARIGLKGKAVDRVDRQPANLVFLLDVSGSMNAANKLPLLKRSLKLAVDQLSDRDRVAIVVYAGASGLVLPSTPFDDKPKILDALNGLEAGGSTNAGSGIQLAYQVAQENFLKDGINRVILATDGDFNVGVTDKTSLVDLVKDKAKSGVFLTVLGFGMGNLKDDMLEKLANNGNGNYAYIDDFSEARKVFSDQISGTLVTIAKDVKIQVEFNPAKVQAYRLIGYENRMLAAQDFNDDTKDAGEIGAGHTVTALYQIVPVGKEVGYPIGKVDDLKYQQPAEPGEKAGPSSAGEWMNVKLRYKAPDGDKSQKIEFPVTSVGASFDAASVDFRFATSVAGFGMLLTDSKYKADLSYDQVRSMADGARGPDKREYRVLFLQMVDQAKALSAAKP